MAKELWRCNSEFNAHGWEKTDRWARDQQIALKIRFYIKVKVSLLILKRSWSPQCCTEARLKYLLINCGDKGQLEAQCNAGESL